MSIVLPAAHAPQSRTQAPTIAATSGSCPLDQTPQCAMGLSASTTGRIEQSPALWPAKIPGGDLPCVDQQHSTPPFVAWTGASVARPARGGESSDQEEQCDQFKRCHLSDKGRHSQGDGTPVVDCPRLQLCLLEGMRARPGTPSRGRSTTGPHAPLRRNVFSVPTTEPADQDLTRQQLDMHKAEAVH